MSLIYILVKATCTMGRAWATHLICMFKHLLMLLLAFSLSHLIISTQTILALMFTLGNRLISIF